MLHSLWDLSSPTKDQTGVLAVNVPSPNVWTTMEFLLSVFFFKQMTESEPEKLDLGEANLMTVGSSVQETLCARHHVECFPSLSSNPADAQVRSRLLLSPFSRQGH